MKTTKQYVIQTLTPATGFSALWAHDHGGSIEIEVRPLDFIAVAAVQELHHDKRIDAGLDVVGVALGEGYFQVVTEYDNCYGIVRDGASWAECLELLPSTLAARTVQPHKGDKQAQGKGVMING